MFQFNWSVKFSFQIGNAYVDSATNDEAGYEFMWYHNLISDETYAKFRKACNFSGVESIHDCTSAESDANVEAGHIDLYNIYAPICNHPNVSSRSGVAVRNHHPYLWSLIYVLFNPFAISLKLLKSGDCL